MNDFREYSDYLIHYGIPGQRRGIRRYQNEDGTLTPEGKRRYLVGSTYENTNIKYSPRNDRIYTSNGHSYDRKAYEQREQVKKEGGEWQRMYLDDRRMNLTDEGKRRLKHDQTVRKAAEILTSIDNKLRSLNGNSLHGSLKKTYTEVMTAKTEEKINNILKKFRIF